MFTSTQTKFGIQKRIDWGWENEVVENKWNSQRFLDSY